MSEEVIYKNQYLDYFDEAISICDSSDHSDKKKIVGALDQMKEFYSRWSEDEWEPEFQEKQDG
jgi:hypothetical protein